MSGRIINVRSFAFLKTNELAAPTHSESHSPTDAKNPQTKESTGRGVTSKEAFKIRQFNLPY